jgi:hypothetical protein
MQNPTLASLGWGTRPRCEIRHLGWRFTQLRSLSPALVPLLDYLVLLYLELCVHKVHINRQTAHHVSNVTHDSFKIAHLVGIVQTSSATMNARVVPSSCLVKNTSTPLPVKKPFDSNCWPSARAWAFVAEPS